MTMSEILKDQKLRNSEYYGKQSTYDELYAKSQKGMTFKYLYKKITDNDNLLLAYRNIKKNGGSKTEGTDGKNIEDISSIGIDEYLKRMKAMLNNYQPKAVKRVEIPKPNGKKRPLGIPSIWDRLVQQAILQVLEPICEAKFYDSSFGFRPNSSSRNAMARAVSLINRSSMYHVVDVDIKSFFDEVNHKKLMRQLWTIGIRDKKVLSIIHAILKAPIRMPNGELSYPTKGTPQGGILSPLLSNIVLNEFDWWIAEQWETRRLRELKRCFKASGIENTWSHRSKLRKTTKLKEMYIVRYADDFKIFTNSRKNAQRIFIAVEKWLDERLKLPISKEKSKITNLKKEESEFLGFNIRAVRKGREKNGKWKYVAHTHVTNKALDRIHNELSKQIVNIQRSLNSNRALAGVMKYNSMVIGVHNYYNTATHVAGDFRRMQDQMNRKMYNRFDKAVSRDGSINSNGYTKNGSYKGKHAGYEPYMKSKRVYYYMKYPVLPIGFVKHRNPMQKQLGICKYTEEGRKLIHKEQSAVSEKALQWLREHPVIGGRASVEYNDNRISLYVAQKGKCAVTGIELEAWDIHCHHKVPYSISHDDGYNNLIIISENVHKLTHAKREKTILKYLNLLKLNEKQLSKVNLLRKKAELDEIDIKQILNEVA